MTTSAVQSGQNPLQSLADPLHELGSRIGVDTPLGDWLMSEVAAPVVLAAGVLLLVLVVLKLLGLRRRARAAASAEANLERAAAAAVASVRTDPAMEAQGRTHPEALSMLYDAPARREPVLAAAAADTAAPQRPAPAYAAPASVAPAPAAYTETASAPRPAAPAADVVVENSSLRLMVSAVDRLLQRVESQQAQIHALLDELKAQSSALLVQGERLLELEARVAGQDNAVPAAAPAPAGEQMPSLEQAIALSAQGADEHELVSQLGLSAAEARLINLVHGQSAASTSRGADIVSG